MDVSRQDEAAGEVGIPGLEKCPGQMGHPVHPGPDPVPWVGGWVEGAKEELCSTPDSRVRWCQVRLGEACEGHAWRRRV